MTWVAPASAPRSAGITGTSSSAGRASSAVSTSVATGRRGEWIQRDDRFEWQADAWLDVPAYPSAPPPAPVVEQPQPARAGYVWVGGFHAWRDGDYVWTPGRWERQKAGRTWVAGQWSLQGDRYVWIEGGWR